MTIEHSNEGLGAGIEYYVRTLHFREVCVALTLYI